MNDFSKIFFTADTHFGHENILKYCNRPFVNIKEHDETIINNWNNIVPKNGMVYHLGDFCFKGHRFYRAKLNGKIILIKGNHDKASQLDYKQFTEIYPFLTKTFNKKITLVMMHYCMHVWPQSHYGSIHLYGHSHGRIIESETLKRCDVGVDVWNFTPVSLELILFKMSFKKEFEYKNVGEANKNVENNLKENQKIINLYKEKNKI